MLEVLREDYVRTARAKGAGRIRVVAVHALRNALIPVVTTIGLQVGTLLRRRDPHRDDLLVARRRQVAGRGDPPARLRRRAGRHPVHGDDRHRRQPDRRRALRRDQSAHPAHDEPTGPARDRAVARWRPSRDRARRRRRELWRDFRATAARSSAWSSSCCSCSARSSPTSSRRTARSSSTATRRCARPSLTPIGGHVFLLGTDEVGRDILSRLIYGTRLSLSIGFVSVGLVADRSACCSAWSPASSRPAAEYADHADDGRDAGAAEPAARGRRRRHARARAGQRDVRDRHRHAAALRAPDARRRARRAREGLRRGVARGRRGHRAADVRHRAAELRRAADRAGDARLLVGDPRRRRARLPRPRRAAADAGVGLDAGRARSSSSRARGGS